LYFEGRIIVYTYLTTSQPPYSYELVYALKYRPSLSSCPGQ